MRYFLDTEFDGFRGPLISLALVREDGRHLYVVVNFGTASDPWVRENVMPVLRDIDAVPTRGNNCACSPRWAAHEIAAFLRDDPDPVIISDWPADIRYLCDLIEFDGGQMAPIRGLKFEMRRVDAYPTTVEFAVQHNALWDAIALRARLMEPA